MKLVFFYSKSLVSALVLIHSVCCQQLVIGEDNHVS